MALTIAVANLKGGVGKLTLTIHIASFLAQAGHKTLIVDTDKQGTCQKWAAAAAANGYAGPAVAAIEGKTLRRDLPRLSEGYDAVVIDSPGKLGIEARAAMISSHLVLLPVCPGPADFWALEETFAVVEDARSLRADLKFGVIFNRADRTALTRSIRLSVEDTGMLLFERTIGNRVAFGEATLMGRGVTEYAPESDAAREIRVLTKAILGEVRPS